MLRFFRVFVALVCFLAITSLFIDVTGFAATHLGWLVKYQLVPALLSLNFVAIVVLVLVTFVFGRVYCSVLCPLGVLQDIISRIRIWLSGKKRRKIGLFHYRKASSAVRYGVLGLFVMLLVLGFSNLLATSLAALIEPYSAYGRIASGVFAPVADGLYNSAAEWEAAHDSYWLLPLARTSSHVISIVGVVTLVVVGLCAILYGRGYCNTVCPVGTVLGLISRKSLMRISIDKSKCNGCASCARHCKGECIDARNHAIDYSRCVACMDCTGHCRQGAIKYTLSFKKGSCAPVVKPQENTVKAKEAPASVDKNRRMFLAISGIATGAVLAKATEKVTDGGLTPLKAKSTHKRLTRIVPPGAVSLDNLSAKCVACQLCIQACPNGIIKPSMEVESFMQPVLDFSNGYCTPECTRCSEVCPTGAIKPVDEPLKSSLKIGTAVVDPDLCLSATEGTDCGNCERHCPTGAVQLFWSNDDPDDNRAIPVVQENLCIGCGACEYHCPVGTVESMKANVAAIHVEGASQQRTI